ncbi:unnamed protein product, partial [Ixodes pacificus]
MPAVTPAGASGAQQPFGNLPPPPSGGRPPPPPRLDQPYIHPPPNWSAPSLQLFARPSRRSGRDTLASPRWRSPSPRTRRTTTSSRPTLRPARTPPAATGPVSPTRSPTTPTRILRPAPTGA